MKLHRFGGARVALLMALAGLAATRGTPQAGPPASRLEAQAYVWQRAWTPGVRSAVGTHATNFSRYVVLAAEVTWSEGKPRLTRAHPDPEALREAGIPVGYALRIAPFPGPFQAEDAVTRWLCGTAATLGREAVADGVSPAELQLDFDCATRQLAGYRTWLQAVRQAVHPVPVCLTALPTWLSEPGFAALVRAGDGYVLQVHSVEKPRGPDAAFTLCNPADARRWVNQAGAVGVPFRVALPTYGYTFGFDPRGRFLGLSAEGPSPAWPGDTRVRQVQADPADMQRLVEGWRADRPPALRGVIWYRLPVAGDALNWRWPTLRAVMEGAPLRSDLVAEKTSSEPGLFEIDLINRGAVAEITPVRVRLRWKAGRLVASDGLGGFVPEVEGPTTLRLVAPAAWKPLEPGARRRIGWVRISAATEVSLEILSTAP